MGRKGPYRDSGDVKKSDEKQYRWVWLGESTGIDEIIYYMFNPNMIVEPPRAVYPVAIGVDYGQMNATTYEAWGLDVAKKNSEGLKNTIILEEMKVNRNPHQSMRQTLKNTLKNCRKNME